MTRKDKKILGGVLLGGLALLLMGATASGPTTQKSPDLGKWINALIQALNKSAYGKAWGQVAADVLEQVAESLLPPPLRFLLHIVYQVERQHLAGRIRKDQKFTTALARALAH